MLRESSSIDGPTCMICLSNIDMSKQIQGWQCPNKHTTIICNKCFTELVKPECPTCKSPIPNTKEVRTFRRKLGIINTLDKITSVVKQVSEIADKYSSPEIREAYEEKMLGEAQTARDSFLEMLTGQAASIITDHFMIESAEEEAELREIDATMMLMHGHEKFRGTPAGAIINGLNTAIKRKAIQDVLRQNPATIVLERAPNQQQ